MGKQPKILAIQGLRGIAVLLVIFFHFDFGFPNGFLGVDVFFVISGFVISRLIHSRLMNNTFRFRDFYYSRFIRLFPALSVTVAVTLLASSILTNLSSFRISFFTGVTAIFGVSNATAQLLSTDYFAPDSRANSLLHTWSLGVEEQFYLVLPLLLYVVYLRARSFRPSIILVVFLTSTASLVLFIFSEQWQQVPMVGALLGYYSPLTRVWEFGAGVLVYMFSNRQPGWPNQVSRFLPVVGSVFVAFACFMDFKELGLESWSPYILAVLGTSLVIQSRSMPNTRSPILASRPLIWLGDRSYSLYLWHWPIASIASQYIELATSFATALLIVFLLVVAHFSYRFLEMGAQAKIDQNTKDRFTPVITVILLTVFSASTWFMPGVFQPDSAMEQEQRVEQPMPYRLDCHDNLVICSMTEPVNKVYPGQRNVYLVGDSNAAQHHAGLSMATIDLEMNLYSLTASNCTGLEIDSKLFLNAEGSALDKCRLYREWMRSQLSSAPPGVVVLGFSISFLENGNLARDETIRYLTESLNEFQIFTSRHGHKLVIVEPIPYWKGRYQSFTPELTPPHFNETEMQYPNVTWKTEIGEIQSWPGINFQDGTVVFETHSLLCTSDLCSLFKDGKFVYQDSTHITVHASKGMAEQWEEVLSSAQKR